MDEQVSKPPTEPRTRDRSVLRTASAVLLFATACFLLQRLSFSLRIPPFQRATVWTPGALLFAALLLAPRRQWWVYYAGLCLGAFAAFYDDRPIPVATALLAAQFHFGAVALGVCWLRRSYAHLPFENLTSFLAYGAIAVVLIPVMTTLPIDVVRFVSEASDVWPVGLRSVLGFGLGTLIATPAFALTVPNGLTWLRTASMRNYLEVVGLAASLIVVGHFCFAGAAGATASPALLYAPLPLLLWAAARFSLLAFVGHSLQSPSNQPGRRCRDAGRLPVRHRGTTSFSFSYTCSPAPCL